MILGHVEPGPTINSLLILILSNTKSGQSWLYVISIFIAKLDHFLYNHPYKVLRPMVEWFWAWFSDQTDTSGLVTILGSLLNYCGPVSLGTQHPARSYLLSRCTGSSITRYRPWALGIFVSKLVVQEHFGSSSDHPRIIFRSFGSDHIGHTMAYKVEVTST